MTTYTQLMKIRIPHTQPPSNLEPTVFASILVFLNLLFNMCFKPFKCPKGIAFYERVVFKFSKWNIAKIPPIRASEQGLTYTPTCHFLLKAKV